MDLFFPEKFVIYPEAASERKHEFIAPEKKTMNQKRRKTAAHEPAVYAKTHRNVFLQNARKKKMPGPCALRAEPGGDFLWFRRYFFGSFAMASISQSAPAGISFTATQLRAGLLTKCFA
jgi:hypothetical protein